MRKLIYFLFSLAIRILDIFRVRKSDAVVVLREAGPYGPPVFEWIYRKMNRNFIYDLDDAIFIPQPSIHNRFSNFLKNPGKVKHIMSWSKVVICAIPFLEEYARKYNSNTVILWSPVDDVSYQPRQGKKSEGESLVIGWIGSHSTQVHPKSLRNVYIQLQKKYPEVKFKFVDVTDFNLEGVNIELKPFRMEEELEDLQDFDIGIYPLIEIPYVEGKCGFKTQQYMGVGIPTVSTPFGGVKDFVEDGVNGFIARNEDEWVDRLSRLIENPGLREEMGKKGRETLFEKELCVSTNAPKMYKVLVDCCKDN